MLYQNLHKICINGRPMTRAEQMAAERVLYSKTENHETVTVKISTDKGLEAKVVNPPKSPNVKLEISGTV
jgi:hypothetical protein